MVAVLAKPSTASVLTFEDLPTPADESVAIPDGYGGINWSAGGWQYYGVAQAPYSAESGLNRIYSYNQDNTFSFAAGPSYFDGAWFAGGSGTNDTVQFQLFRDTQLVFTSSSLFLTDTPQFLASGYSGLVDAIAIAESPVVRPSDTDFVMDDVTFRSASPVPEPGNVFLLSLGAVSVSLWAWAIRLKKKIKLQY